MRLFLFSALLLAGASALSSAYADELLESCYTVADTDLSDNAIQLAISVEAYRGERGDYLKVFNQSNWRPILEDIPVTFRGDRSHGSWHYEYPGAWANPRSEFASLEVYRTSEKLRTPTTVNAHFYYVDPQRTTKIKASRLECEKHGV